MSRLSKHRFLNLPLAQQHKKAAEAARQLYEGEANQYEEMRKWLEMEPIVGAEALADAYHKHLRKTGRGLKEHNLLPHVRRKDRQEKGLLLPYSLYLDEIRSAHNVGSILRSAEAFNVERVFFSRGTPPPTHPQVQKTSMGAWKWVSWKVVDRLPERLIALETCEGAIPISEFVFPEGCVIAIGNEEYGCSRTVLESAQQVVEIPLSGRKNSLNVANACAIALYSVSRLHK